ncbi:MAG: hypothetical protein NDI69_02170 [Bacteriovoracaceae bacterium]|nr:hypothetical protein [Bacteriovoracaceae bacterium]
MKIIITILMMLILTSCQESGELKPQEPLWGREGCARCRMVLSEKRYAVQRVLSNGEIHFYDDLNCALQHKHDEDKGTLYVHPHGKDQWILAEQAKYQSGLRTPMNSGYGAVNEGGEITFSEVQEKFKE